LAGLDVSSGAHVKAFLTLIGCLAVLLGLSQPTAWAGPASTDCADFTCIGGGHQVGVGGSVSGGARKPGQSTPASSGANPRVVYTDCGSALGSGGIGAPACNQALAVCRPTAPTVIPAFLHVIATTTYPLNGGAPSTTVNCFVDTRWRRPALTTAAITQEIRRLLPTTPIGTPQPVSLVNFKVLLWLNTPAARDLGPVTLLGRRVQIRVALTDVDWNFGDQQTDTTHDPGQPYDPTHDCGSCPDVFGHTYTAAAGRRTISATAAWSASFNVDNAGWTNLPAPVTGPTAAVTIQLRQSRSTLITDPAN
jgi:hypothetical protein